MKNKIEFDKNNRTRYKKNFWKRLQEQILQQNEFFKKKTKIQSSIGTKSRLHNFCIQTGRSRGVSRFCRFSRGVLRHHLDEGNLLGWSKASW
jgi:ribosomal protein S14